MERNYKQSEAGGLSKRAEAGRLPAIDSARTQSALADLQASYALVGQAPPEPPTWRGRIGSRLVRIVQRLLFWYTPQIVHFQYSALRAIEELANDACHDRQEMRAALANATALTEVLQRRLEELRLEAIPRIERELARVLPQQIANERRITTLIEEARKGLPEPLSSPQAQRLSDEERHGMDAFYAALEDEFRGSRKEIKERLNIYVPKLTDAGIGSESMPILDVGCGRGEWLELLREHQLRASGIDLNRVALALCQELGLPATEADAIAHLRGLPDASLGAVTAFHVIEHMALPRLLALLDEIRRVLKPGGLAIFETPNPNNVFVSSRNFYLDPTHRHPIPPLLGRFLVKARGFERVEILELHPWPEQHRIDTRTGGKVAARFNDCFYGPQDYAIVCWKA